MRSLTRSTIGSGKQNSEAGLCRGRAGLVPGSRGCAGVASKGRVAQRGSFRNRTQAQSSRRAFRTLSPRAPHFAKYGEEVART